MHAAVRSSLRRPPEPGINWREQKSFSATDKPREKHWRAPIGFEVPRGRIDNASPPSDPLIKRLLVPEERFVFALVPRVIRLRSNQVACFLDVDLGPFSVGPLHFRAIKN